MCNLFYEILSVIKTASLGDGERGESQLPQDNTKKFYPEGSVQRGGVSVDVTNVDDDPHFDDNTAKRSLNLREKLTLYVFKKDYRNVMKDNQLIEKSDNVKFETQIYKKMHEDILENPTEGHEYNVHYLKHYCECNRYKATLICIETTQKHIKKLEERIMKLKKLFMRAGKFESSTSIDILIPYSQALQKKIEEYENILNDYELMNRILEMIHKRLKSYILYVLNANLEDFSPF